MDNRYTFLTSLRSGLLISVVSILISCGGSGDSTGTSTDTTTAVTNASKVVTSVLDTNAAAISAVAVDSAALTSLLESAGITLADTSSTGLTDDLGNFLAAMLDNNTAVITRIDNTITVRPAVTEFCDLYATTTGIATDDPLYTTCRDIMVDVLLVIEVTGDQTGTLSVSHNGSTPVHVQYSPTQLIYTIDLAGAVAALESVMAVIDPDTVLDLPTTIAGTLVVDMEVLGDQHATTEISISQAITMLGSVEGLDINITIDPATLFAVEVDGIAGTATMSSSLNAMTAEYPVDIGTSEAPYTVPGVLTLDAASLSLTITDAGAGLTGEVGVGPLNIKLENPEAVNFFLDPKFSIDPVTGVITLDTPLQLELKVIDTSTSFFGMDGDLTVTTDPTGTSFIEVAGVEDPNGPIYKVVTGYINISATLIDFIDAVGTISKDECFNMDGAVACPLI